MSADLKRIGLEACVLVVFGVLAGLAVNHQLVMDAFSGKLVPPRDAPQREAPVALPMPVLLDELRTLQADGALIVDARSPELYAEGHIDGAVPLPLVDIDPLLPAFLASVPKERVIVTYCSGFGCPDSFDLGMRLLQEGFLDVRVFEGGYPEWRDAGLPVAEGNQ